MTPTAVGQASPVAQAEQPVAPETNAPGDIPDNQAFVAFSSPTDGYQLQVPEGWGRTANGSDVRFVSKLDGVQVTIASSSVAPTAASAQATQVAELQRSGRAVQVGKVQDVQLPVRSTLRPRRISWSCSRHVAKRVVPLSSPRTARCWRPTLIASSACWTSEWSMAETLTGTLTGSARSVLTRRAMVDADGVGRTYRRGTTNVAALVSATCTVSAGDRIALVGPSGSGKSTLLHLMGGLDTPSSGEIVWPALGARETLRPARVAFVFQTPSLLPSLSVVENVELPLLLGHATGDAARTAARDALQRIGLLEIADKLPEELSGGQGQRVAVARALAHQPQLILADEPTGQPDHGTSQHLFDVLLAALDGTASALVVATHDLAVADRMHTVWYLRHGILEVPDPC